METKEARIDKYLWSVRVYKTRSQATEACRSGKISMADTPVKPSRVIKPGDLIKVRKLPVVYTYRVKEVPCRRVSAKLVLQYLEDLTPREELDKLNKDHITIVFQRERGAGRPTKKDRRLIDKVRDNN